MSLDRETRAVSSGRLACGRLVRGLQATADSGLTAQRKSEATRPWERGEGPGPPTHPLHQRGRKWMHGARSGKPGPPASEGANGRSGVEEKEGSG